MSAPDVCRVVEHNGQGMPSLVHVLSTLAAYWRLCECGLEIGRDGKDGWQQKCERLESELYPLQGKIERLEKLNKVTTDPRQLMQQETELAELQAELSLLSAEIQAKEAPTQAEWEQAHNETDAYRELFWDAREFCVKACGIEDHEVFNAALVGFDPSQLKPGQEPSKQRMPEIVLLLRNLKRHEWETQPWANLTQPKMRARRRVTPDRLNLFNVRNLKESIADPNLQPTTSVKAGGKGGKAGDETRDVDVSVEFVESAYAEPTFKSDLAFSFGVDRAAIARRIQSGELRTTKPASRDKSKKRWTATKVDEHIREALNSGDAPTEEQYLFATGNDLERMIGCNRKTAMDTKFWTEDRTELQQTWRRKHAKGKRPRLRDV